VRARFAVVAARIAADVSVWVLGFRAVSDDDFARVVIAQGFARSPSLDPSGTSWLPLPFWLTGSVMMLAGRDLWVARATAIVVGVLASLLIHQAALWILGDARRALAGTLVATAIPWGARLGVATVPELGAAACTLFAVASMTPGSPPKRRLAGAAALAAACLCRYEPWFVVAPFAVLTVVDAARARASRPALFALAGAAVVAVAAPALWIAWNQHAHGDPLAFVARVASYKRALGAGTTGLVDTARGTAASMFAAEPELWLALLALLGGWCFSPIPARSRRRACSRTGSTLRATRHRPRLVSTKTTSPPPRVSWSKNQQLDSALLGVGRLRRLAIAVPPTWRRPLLIFAVAIGCLIVAGARDGAPTHHPERALLAPILLAAILAGSAASGAVQRIHTMQNGVAFGAAAIAIVVGGWFARNWWRPVGALGNREAHARVGHEAASAMLPGQKVLVEVANYGYFAILAGSGRPEDFIPDRSLDPRATLARSSFESVALLDARVDEIGARAVVGRRSVLGSRCPIGDGEICWAPVGRWAREPPGAQLPPAQLPPAP